MITNCDAGDIRPMDTDEWQEGRLAFKTKADCPYKIATKEYDLWEQGYQDAEADAADKYYSNKYFF